MPGLLGVSPLLVLFGEFFVPYLPPSGRGVEIFSSKGICYIYIEMTPETSSTTLIFSVRRHFCPPPYPLRGDKGGANF